MDFRFLGDFGQLEPALSLEVAITQDTQFQDDWLHQSDNIQIQSFFSLLRMHYTQRAFWILY